MGLGVGGGGVGGCLLARRAERSLRARLQLLALPGRLFELRLEISQLRLLG